MSLTINATILKETLSGDSGTSSGTIVSSGSNRVGYLAIGTNRATAGHMTASWGATPMTRIDDRLFGTSYIVVFRTTTEPPTTGQAISYAGGDSSVGGFVAFTAQDNDTGTPTGSTVSADGASVDVPSDVGEIAIAAQFQFGGGAPTANSPSVLIDTIGNGGFNVAVAKRTGANPTSTIAFNTGGPTIGFSLLPAAVTPPASTTDGKIVIQAA